MPSLDPILLAPFAIQLHVFSAICAIALLPWTIFRRRRDSVHKIAGYLWVIAMSTAALSSFFINEIQTFGPFSAIHLIAIYTLFGLWQAVRAAIRRDIAAHQAGMTWLSVGALGVAGTFALMPGRRMNQILFGAYGEEGFFLAIACAVVVIGTMLSQRLRRRA